MRIIPNSQAMTTATTSFHVLFIVHAEDNADAQKRIQLHHSEGSADDLQSDSVLNANTVELRIFSMVFIIFILVASYFVIKGLVRTWKRRSADYLLTWAQQKQNTCKCNIRPKSIESLQILETIVKEIPNVVEVDEDTGSPTTSSGVGTVDSSDASAETGSTNPLLDILHASASTDTPSPTPTQSVTVAEIALIHTSLMNESTSVQPILAENRTRARRKRSCNSSPPSPVFPRRRSEFGDQSISIDKHKHRKHDAFTHQHHRHPRRRPKRRVSLDAGEERIQNSYVYLYGLPAHERNIGISAHLSLPSNVTNEWRPSSRMWIDDEDEAGSLSIPLSVATAPPDYFDTMNAEWERQGFCPLYKSHRTRGTVTVPGTP